MRLKCLDSVGTAGRFEAACRHPHRRHPRPVQLDHKDECTAGEEMERGHGEPASSKAFETFVPAKAFLSCGTKSAVEHFAALGRARTTT